MRKVKEEDFIPEKLQFEIGGFGSNCCAVEFMEGKLFYSRPPCLGLRNSHEGTEVNPSPSDWKQFWHKVEEFRVWKWKKHYDDPYVLDGTQWSLTLQINEKKVKSYGSNEYPEYFDQFLKEMSALLGGLVVG